jgi:surface antigen
MTARLERSLRRKATRRRVIRYGLLAVNVAVLAAVVGFVSVNSRSETVASALLAAPKDTAVNPLDRPTSYDIAANIANAVQLPEAPLINGQVVAEKVQSQHASSDASGTLAAKPQVVSTVFKSNKDIKKYVVQAGDTVTSVAAKFGVNSNSVRWSNSLSGDALTAGKTLSIPPVDSIVYTVKSGDTIDSLAQTYNANRSLIVAYNDAELKGLQVGEQILIPGTLPTPTVSSFGGYNYGGSFANVAGNYNMYAYHNCTWWVAYRWAQVGHPIMPLLGNASQWYANGQSAGLEVGRTPRQYAAAVTGGLYGVNTWGWGHVAFVEGVNGDGSVNISEMNVDGWASSRVWRTTVPASVAAGWYYVYP